MGTLSELGQEQESFRGLFRDIKIAEVEDQTFEGAIVRNTLDGADEDLIVHLATVLSQCVTAEILADGPRFLVLAQEIIDHLDTINLKIASKHGTPS